MSEILSKDEGQVYSGKADNSLGELSVVPNGLHPKGCSTRCAS